MNDSGLSGGIHHRRCPSATRLSVHLSSTGSGRRAVRLVPIVVGDSADLARTVTGGVKTWGFCAAAPTISH
jgi:hypothetical protein